MGAVVGGIGGALIGGPAGAAAGASIGGALDSYSAQQQANKRNIEQSDKQMAFQERMSSTAHQRQVADLKKAGLNPILSANTGASSPTGSMAQVQPEDPKLAQSLATAIELKRMNQDLKNAKAIEKQTKQQTEKVKTETTLLKSKEPQARIINKGGKALESIYNSASKADVFSKIDQSVGYSAKKNKVKVQQAETKALKNYKKSQAYKDARRKRKK